MWPRSPGPATLCASRKWSPDPVQEQENRRSAVCKTLCRTRTGDPFLTSELVERILAPRDRHECALRAPGRRHAHLVTLQAEHGVGRHVSVRMALRSVRRWTCRRVAAPVEAQSRDAVTAVEERASWIVTTTTRSSGSSTT